MTVTGLQRIPRPSAATVTTVRLAAVVVISGAVGVVLAAVGGLAGPLVMLGLPLGIVAGVLSVLRPRFGLALFVLSLPVGVTSVPKAPGDMKFVHAAALVAVVAIVLHRLAAGHAPLGWAAPAWWLLGISAMALAATPGALDVSTAIKQDVTLAIGIGLVFAIPAACANLAELRPVVLWLLVVGAVMCATSFGSASQLQAAYNAAIVNNRAVGVFHQPNELGTFAGMLLMIAVGVLAGARSFLERVVAVGSGLCALAALTLTLSRGAWLGAVLAGIFVAWLLPRARRAFVFVGIPLVIVVAALGAYRPDAPQLQIVTERVQSITEPAANPYDDRPAIYREAGRIIEAHPLLGVGPENFIVAATKSTSDTQTVAPLHAHNFVLTVAAELGLPAAALLIGMTLSVGLRVVRARRLRDPAERALTVGLGAAFVVLVGQGFVDFTMRNPIVFMFVWAVLGMAFVAVRDVDAAEAMGPRRGRRALSAR